MDYAQRIRDYLKDRQDIDRVMPDLPFITISRQAGADAHLLAYVIISDFQKERNPVFHDWHVFDRELCEIIAQEPELHTSIEALLSEEYESQINDFFETLITGHSRQYELHRKTFGIVRMLAMLGKVVIVGRAASFIAHNLPGGIHIRLISSEAKRQKCIMSKMKVTATEAVKLMRKQDSDRAKLVRTYFNKDIDDPLNYHATWNSDVTEFHEISHSLVEMIKHRNVTNK